MSDSSSSVARRPDRALGPRWQATAGHGLGVDGQGRTPEGGCPADSLGILGLDLVGQQLGHGPVGRGAPLGLALVLAGIAGAWLRHHGGRASLHGPTIGDGPGAEDGGSTGTTRLVAGPALGAASAGPPSWYAPGPAHILGTAAAAIVMQRRFGAEAGGAAADEAAKALTGDARTGSRAGAGLGAMHPGLVAPTQLRREHVTPQHGVDGLGHVGVDGNAIAILDLHDDVECRRGLALQHRLLRPSPPCLVVAERDRLDAADEVGQGRIHHQVVEVVAVGGADQLHATLGDGARGQRLELRADLVDDDDLGHVVLDSLDHDRVLQVGCTHLHAPGAADARVGDVAVAGDLVGGIDDDDALVQVIRQHARGLAQHRRLADAGAAHDEDGLARFHEVVHDLDGAEDSASDPAGQAHDLAVAIADGADAMQRTLDAGAVVLTEGTHVVDHVLDVLGADLALREDLLATAAETGLRLAAQVHDHLDDGADPLEGTHAPTDLRAAGRRAARRGRPWWPPVSPVRGSAGLDSEPASTAWGGMLADMGSSDGGVVIRRPARAWVRRPAPVPP